MSLPSQSLALGSTLIAARQLVSAALTSLTTFQSGRLSWSRFICFQAHQGADSLVVDHGGRFNLN